MLASSNDRVEVVKALIAAGASLHLQNKVTYEGPHFLANVLMIGRFLR
jgi:hypothetical protein